MAVGDKILSEDYNNIQRKIAAVLGTGGTVPNSNPAQSNPTFGYGQTLQSSEVNLGEIITKTQWDNLKWDIYNALIHQTNSTPALQAIVANSKIRATILDYDNFADTAVNNRLTVDESQLAIEGGTPTTGVTTSRNFSWSESVSSTITVNFANANDARYFFNTGGKIRIASNFVKTLNTPQNVAWENLLSAAGIQELGHNEFYNLTNELVEWYSTSSSSAYANNNYKISIRSNVPNNSNGTATQVIFSVTWTDGYEVTGDFPGTTDLVQGILSLTANQKKAITKIEPGTSIFNIAGPSLYSITLIQ